MVAPATVSSAAPHPRKPLREALGMAPWPQDYHPTGGLITSTLLAAVPVVVLLALLGLFHVRAHWSALIGLGTALLIAILVYRMPVGLAGRSAALGAAYGLFPIGWIVLAAIFVYDITVYTGQFE